MKAFKLFIALATLMIAAASHSQGMMMMGGAGGGGESFLLFRMSREGASIRSDVGKELKLTSDQEKKLMAVQDGQRQKMMDMFQGGGFDPSDREKMQKVIGDMLKESDKEVKAILDETQKARLHELWIQQQGNNAIANETVQKELAMTDEQKAKVKSLMDKSQEANRAMMERVRNQEIDFQQVRETSEKNGKVLKEELGKILTTDQAAKLKKMGGAEFKFENAGG